MPLMRGEPSLRSVAIVRCVWASKSSRAALRELRGRGGDVVPGGHRPEDATQASRATADGACCGASARHHPLPHVHADHLPTPHLRPARARPRPRRLRRGGGGARPRARRSRRPTTPSCRRCPSRGRSSSSPSPARPRARPPRPPTTGAAAPEEDAPKPTGPGLRHARARRRAERHQRRDAQRDGARQRRRAAAARGARRGAQDHRGGQRDRAHALQVGRRPRPLRRHRLRLLGLGLLRALRRRPDRRPERLRRPHAAGARPAPASGSRSTRAPGTSTWRWRASASTPPARRPPARAGRTTCAAAGRASSP